MFILKLFLLLCLTFCKADKTSNVGDKCAVARIGSEGTCTRADNCTVGGYTQRDDHSEGDEGCGYDKQIQLICCPDPPQQSTTLPPFIPRSLSQMSLYTNNVPSQT